LYALVRALQEALIVTPFNRLFRAAVFAVCAGVLIGWAQGADPQDAPPAADLKEAVEVLKDAFEKDYNAGSFDPKAKRTLARKLFDGALKRKTPALRYASFEEARRLAAEGGDIRLALDALGALTTNFRNTPPDLGTDTLTRLAASELLPESAAGLMGLAGDAIDSALQRQDFVTAVALGKLLVSAAKKAEDPDVLIDARRVLARLEALASALEVIKTKPDDPAANEALGRYWAFIRGRFDEGLKYLAKSPNKDLATTAANDLKNPTSAAGCTAVANAWYRLARDHSGLEHRRLIERAWEWYSAAVLLGAKDPAPGERLAEIERTHPDLFMLKFEGHTEGVAGVAVSPDGKVIVSVSNDKSVRVWDPTTGKPVTALLGHTGWVGSVVITPDGARAITAGGGGKAGDEPQCEIRVWDLHALKEVMKLEGHTVAVRSLALTNDGKTLISGGGDRTCRAWDLTTGKELRRYGDEKDGVESVSATPDGKYVLIGTDTGTVIVHDAKTGDVVSRFTEHPRDIVYAITTTPDGKTALSGGREPVFRAWDIATGKELRKFTGHGETVYQLALSRDGKHVLSASLDRSARVWDVATGKELKKLTGHGDAVQGVCFSPDGRYAFTASWDKTVRRWRLPPFPVVKKVD
jgi:tetratricopeptide (TPR) repeat protein